MSVLIAVDLDQTVVFSKRSAGEAGPSVVVEHLDGEPLSSMTVGAVEAYRALAERHLVVPVTTRTVAQYSRITLPTPPAYAVCANGGVLLTAEGPDEDWAAWVRAVCALSAPIAEVEAHLDKVADEEWVRLTRTAEGLFCYLVAHSRPEIPADWLTGLSAELGELGWGVSVQGRKVYAVPAGLSKASAVQRLVDQVGATSLLAAGDSLLDQPLLELAALSGGAVRPRHGELEELGWAGAHVTSASGARAGEELLGWLAVAAGHPRS
jgi:hydroxymethylpyrimidine pyrophosphatase-like HAD family hydrolase